MKKKNKQRRNFLKTLLGFSLFSVFPLKITAINSMQECITTPDIEGPYYIPNAPDIDILTPKNITPNLCITGTVYANDCITPISNATVEVWHANQGEYNKTTQSPFIGNSYLNSDYENNLYRSKIFTDNSGNYGYDTIVPGKYLNGSYYRPSHIHYKASYLNQNELTTQLYFEGDDSIDLDPWASNPSSENRIIPLTTDENGCLQGVFDITLNIDPEEITQSFIRENKIIQAIYPNPINPETYIYLYKKYTPTIIHVCDINGKIINQKKIFKHKIRLYDVLPKNLKKGIYIIKTTTNNGLIDAKRFYFS